MKGPWYVAMLAFDSVPPPRRTRSSVRVRQAWLLARLSGAFVRWQPALGATLLTAGVLAWSHGDLASWKVGVWSLRVIALLLTLGAAFALDDASAGLIAPVPMPLPARALFRVGLVLAWVAPAWAVSLAVIAPHMPAIWALWSSLEFAGLLAAGLAVAALTARRYGVPEPGTVTSAAIVAAWLVIFALPERITLTSLRPQDWTPAHLRWALLCAIALAILAAMSRDPAHSPR